MAVRIEHLGASQIARIDAFSDVQAAISFGARSCEPAQFHKMVGNIWEPIFVAPSQTNMYEQEKGTTIGNRVNTGIGSRKKGSKQAENCNICRATPRNKLKPKYCTEVYFCPSTQITGSSKKSAGSAASMPRLDAGIDFTSNVTSRNPKKPQFKDYFDLPWLN